MTDWSAFSVVQELLVVYFFGSNLILSLVILGGLLLVFSALSNVRYALGFVLPAAAGIAAGGWFGAELWTLNAVLLVAGLVYGFFILRITAQLR